MKKIFSILALAGMIMTTACSNENNEPVISSDEASVTFTVSLNDIDSRAISDGTTVDQLVFAVYDEQGNELTALRQDDIQIEGKQAIVTTHVAMGQKYSFAFWAQKRGNTFYNTANLKDVVVSYEAEANDESRDAFTASWTTVKVTGPINETITLTRPFAQVDYVCDIEEWEKVIKSTYQLKGSDFTVGGGAYTHLNILTGEVSEPTALSLSRPLDNSFVSSSSKVNNQYQHQDLFNYNGSDKFWLSMNYILAAKDAQTSLTGVTMNIYSTGEGDALVPYTVNIDEMPIQRNHRTVVYIQDITKVVTVNVGIDPNWGGDFNY